MHVITMTLHGRHGVRDHQQFNRLFNSFRLRITTNESSALLSICSTFINGWWITHTRTVLRKEFPYHAGKSFHIMASWHESTPGHYNDVIMSAMASQITSLTIVYSTVYSGAYQRKHQSSALLAFVRGIHRRPVNSPHKGPVTRKMFPFDDVIGHLEYNTECHIMVNNSMVPDSMYMWYWLICQSLW